VTKSKKSSVDFLQGFRSMEERNAVKRHPPVKPATMVTEPTNEVPLSPPASQQRSRWGKVAITLWVDPAVRKQLARMSIDHDSKQAALVAEALNLLFEKYGQPPIATHIQEDPLLSQSTA